MSDEQAEKILRLLQEIRDLTKVRNEKFDSYLETSRQRYDEALQRQKEAQQRLLAQRRRFLWTLAPLLLVAIAFIAYLAFWVIPKSERQDAERWMDQMRIVESNQVAKPR